MFRHPAHSLSINSVLLFPGHFNGINYIHGNKLIPQPGHLTPVDLILTAFVGCSPSHPHLQPKPGEHLQCATVFLQAYEYWLIYCPLLPLFNSVAVGRLHGLFHSDRLEG